MTKTQLLVLSDYATELKTFLDKDGPITLLATPRVELGIATVHSSLVPGIDATVLEAISQAVSISCSFDPAVTRGPMVRDVLNHTAMAFQLSKPTRDFCENWGQLDDKLQLEAASSRLRSYPNPLSNLYLDYQQHHSLSLDDLERTKRVLPRLHMAFEPGHGSWNHPCLPVHRALIFFGQGYSVKLDPLPQFLWAAGLDSLFTSKLDRRKRGAHTISERLKTLFGSEFRPYQGETVLVPPPQSRPDRPLREIGPHIFWLRNAYAHGLPIPEAWLTSKSPIHSGYAYQLCECTEILLRLSLLRLLQDQELFNTFVDPKKLDRYFG